jgi:hypothetical protein
MTATIREDTHTDTQGDRKDSLSMPLRWAMMGAEFTDTDSIKTA